MVLPLKVHFQEMGKNKKNKINKIIICFSRDTILTFDRRVNITNETECLHKLGLSKELRGGLKSQHDIEQIRALLPEAFRDFATGKIYFIIIIIFNPRKIEMAISGSLKTLFETRTSSNIKTRTSTTTTATPIDFVPPSYFKVDGKCS